MIVGLDPSAPHIQPEAQALRPVGSIIKLYVSTNPATLLGFGAWQRTAQGRIHISLNEMDTDLALVGGTGGEKNHTLSSAENPQHTHPGTASVTSHNHEGGSLSATSSETSHVHNYTIRSDVDSTVNAVINYGSEYSGYHNTTGRTQENSAHTHGLSGSTASVAASGSGTTSIFQGGGLPHNNMPPFFSVYIWKRTA